MGAGIVEDVAGRLVADMATRLEALLSTPRTPPAARESPAAPPPGGERPPGTPDRWPAPAPAGALASPATRSRAKRNSGGHPARDQEDDRCGAPEFTLTAGPTMASPRVLAALGSPILFDYDPVFLERFRETERLLAEVYRTTNDVVLMQGEAVLGLEAAARGLVAPGMRCLNLVSGRLRGVVRRLAARVRGRRQRGARPLRRGDRPRRGRAGAGRGRSVRARRRSCTRRPRRGSRTRWRRSARSPTPTAR